MKTLLSIIKNMPAAQYHATSALGSTAVTTAAMRSVAHYIADQEKAPTEAMNRGTASHVTTLQSEAIGRDYVVAPVIQCIETTKKKTQCSRDSLPGAHYCKQHGGEKESEEYHSAQRDKGIEVISHPIYEKALETARGVRDSVARSDYPGILDGGERELSLFAFANVTDETYEITPDEHPGSIAVKARLDLSYPQMRVIIDAKGSTKSETLVPLKFAWAIKNRGLHIQAALYIDIFRVCFDVPADEPVQYTWLVHEQDAPYAVRFFDADEDDISDGRDEVHKGLLRWKAYFDTGDKWSGWPKSRRVVSIPGKEQI